MVGRKPAGTTSPSPNRSGDVGAARRAANVSGRAVKDDAAPAQRPLHPAHPDRRGPAASDRRDARFDAFACHAAGGPGVADVHRCAPRASRARLRSTPQRPGPLLEGRATHIQRQGQAERRCFDETDDACHPLFEPASPPSSRARGKRSCRSRVSSSGSSPIRIAHTPASLRATRIAPRRAGAAARPAVDTGRAHRVDEAAAGLRIARADRCPTHVGRGAGRRRAAWGAAVHLVRQCVRIDGATLGDSGSRPDPLHPGSCFRIRGSAGRATDDGDRFGPPPRPDDERRSLRATGSAGGPRRRARLQFARSSPQRDALAGDRLIPVHPCCPWPWP